MNLLELFGFKRQTSRAKYDAATITVADRQGGQFRRSDVSSMVARFLGYTAVCANLNADALCTVTWRLYRQKRARTRWARAVSKDARERLQSGACGNKVALYARQIDESMEEVLEHPLLEVLLDPCPEDTEFGYPFWQLFNAQKEVCGNAFLHVVFDASAGRPWLFLLQPQAVSIQPLPGGTVEYWYGRDTLTRQRFPSDEILHAKFRKSSWSPWWGVGCLQAILPEHDLRAAMNQHALTLFDNRAVPDFAVMYEERVGEDQVKQIEDRIRNKFGGVENSGQFLVASGVKDIKLLGYALKDLDYQTGRKAVESDIMAAFGVPESMLRLNDANLASATTGNAQYARQTVVPRALAHQEWLNQELVPLVEGTEGYFFAFDNPVPIDVQAESLRRDTAIRNGSITLNEARLEMGLEKYPDEFDGDVPRFQGIPLDVLAMPPQPQSFGSPEGQEPEAREEDDSDENAEETEVRAVRRAPAARTEFVADRADDVSNDDAKASRTHKPKQVKQSDLFSGAAHSCAGHKDTSTKPDPPAAFVVSIDKYFGSQRDATIRAMQENPSGYAKRAPQLVTKDREAIEREVSRLLELWGIKSDAWNGRLEEVIRPPAQTEMQAAMQNAVRAVLALGADTDLKPEDVGLGNPVARPWIEKHGREVMRGIRGVNDTTADMLARTFAEGLEAKEGLNGLINRVKVIYDEQIAPGTPRSRYRAEVIARTELSRAQVMGERAGYEATDVVKGMRWLVSPLPCEFCESAAREWGDKSVPIGEPFYPLGAVIQGTEGGTMVVDYMPVYGGDLHPQCVLGDTRTVGVDVLSVMRAQYRGEAIELRFASGERLAVTVNHRFLTPDGIVPAHALEEGGYVLRCLDGNGRMLDAPNDDDVPPPINEVFNTACMSRGVASASVPVAAEHLHGDGRFCQGKVYVERTHGLLRCERDTKFTKVIAKSLLQWANVAESVLLDRSRYLGPMLSTLGLATDSIVSSPSTSLPLLGSPSRSGRVLSGAVRANGNVSTQENAAHGSAGYAESLRYCELRFPGLVTTDQIIGIERIHADCHVYDLHTASGLAVHNGIITTNCVCSTIPVLKGVNE